MDLSESVVTCAVTIEWLNATGATGRKLVHRVATLRLIRSDAREIFVEISTEKTKSIKFKLHNVTLHNKFMTEGKASIKFNTEKCVLFLSNAPLSPLVVFLRTMLVKLSGVDDRDAATIKKAVRAHLLSGRPSQFEEISPVTTAELAMARKAAGLKSSTTTPSPPQAKKRKFEEIRQSKMPLSAKSLYAPSPLAEEPIKMSEEQNKVLQACQSGKSVFFTGSAGTGKSFLLRKIISALPPDGTVATASTGVAACLIGGTTLHSFAGIGSGDATMSRCFDMASRSMTAQNWRKCKRLIIDEISMVDGEFFDKIELVARHIRKNDRPFGGIQLILCGDFFQLPPVRRDSNSQKNSGSNEKLFCFQSASWDKCIQIVFELKQVHRQLDPEFVKILNHIRIGHVTEDVTKQLLATAKQKIESHGILATQLCSHTNDANSINESKLESLPGEKTVFRAEDSDPSSSKHLDSVLQVPGSLELKIGAQVMLLKNISVTAGLVNGARGIVHKYTNGLPVVRFKNNTEYLCKQEKWSIKHPGGAVITRKQVPLKLAWAFSIHKSQGLTLDCVEMSLAKVFEAGQAYVALSRAKSLDSIRILDFDERQVWANSTVLQYYKTFRRRLHEIEMIPLGGGNSRELKKKTSSNSIGGGTSLTNKMKKTLMEKPIVTIC